MVPPDLETSVSTTHFAVVFVPGRTRQRVTAGCVTLQADADAAVRQARPEERRYAARVHGPSRSSEGQSLYYVLEWLDITPAGRGD